MGMRLPDSVTLHTGYHLDDLGLKAWEAVTFASKEFSMATSHL